MLTSFISLAAPHVSIKYKDKEYYFTALTFQDCAAYILWYKYKEYHEDEEQLKDAPDELRINKLAEIFDKCSNKVWEVDGKTLPLSWETPEIQDSTNTPDGIIYQAYLALRHKHPDLTLKEADEIVTLETYEKVMQKLLEVQGLYNKDSSLGEANSPINLRKARKKRAKARR